MRCFISLDFEDTFKDKLLSNISFFSKDIGKFKVVHKNNLHFTFNFFDNLDVSQIELIKKNVFSHSFESFMCVFDKIGVFPDKLNPKVLFISSSDSRLLMISKKIDDFLGDLYVRNRDFVPHITLLRISEVYNLFKFEEIVKSIKQEIVIKFNQLSFYSSKLTPLGPIYTLLEKKRLS